MNNKQLLIDGIKELGLSCNDDIAEKFAIYQDVLLDWNEKINLTRIVEEDEVILKHFVDSLACLTLDVIKHDAKIIDIGTGAGFPGVPLKIYYNGLDLTLLDSLNKRIKYLRELCDELDLEGVEFLHSRSEDAAKSPEYREQYDVAIARAVAELNVLVELCMPYVKVGGYFIAQKGPKIKEEIDRAKKAIETLGGELIDIKEARLPFTDIDHNIVIIKKVRNTPKKYPRKAGTPSKSPL